MVKDLALLLPDDLLADVLGRVTPRGLAASRCVCRAWRELIDDRGLLRTDLLPLSLAGFFLLFSTLDDVNQIEYQEPEFFARSPADITYFTPSDVEGHCNGLILEYDSVFNPATGGRAALPEPPVSSSLDDRYFCEHQYLAFDLTVSPHYEVFLAPFVGYNFHGKVHPEDDVLLLQSEWPPSLFMLRVFSSRTGRWEERSFVREGEEVAGTVADLGCDGRFVFPHHAVHWRGALYILCQKDFVVRFSLSDYKYRVIKPPSMVGIQCYEKLHLGKSQKGVYCAVLDNKHHLWVWILQGSGEQMEWAMKHHSGCALALPSLNCYRRVHGPWFLQNSNGSEEGASSEAIVEQEREEEWNSDDESILPAEDRVQKHHGLSFYSTSESLGFILSKRWSSSTVW